MQNEKNYFFVVVFVLEGGGGCRTKDKGVGRASIPTFVVHYKFCKSVSGHISSSYCRAGKTYTSITASELSNRVVFKQ